MTPTQMRSFHAVAKSGSFTAAAELLHVSQPTVTIQVSTLEQRYGVELFYRHGRGVHLTETGRMLFALTQVATANVQEATDLLKEAGGLRAGRLRVAAIGPAQVVRILTAFHRRHPNVDLAVTFGNSQQVEQALVGYQADIGILGEIHEFQRFHTQGFSRPEIVMVVGQSHPWAKRSQVRIAELAGQPIIMREPGSETRRILERAARTASVALTPVMEIGSREGLMAAVIGGIGIGAVSAEELPPHQHVHPVRIADAEMFTIVDIACLQERKSARLHQAFFDAADEARAEVLPAQTPRKSRKAASANVPTGSAKGKSTS
jgi:aminoethylphosphonate catabolism LysR family transcriptional regulator